MHPTIKIETSTIVRFISLFVLVILNVRAVAQETAQDLPITVLWTERIPFQYTDENGDGKGILVDLGKKIFRQSGLAHTWMGVPANRVIKLIEINATPICAVGWYKSVDREKIAQFSRPIYQDMPLRGVFRAKTVVPDGIAAKAVTGNPKIRVVAKLGFAYGPYLDALISDIPPARIQRVSVDAPQVLLMIRADRADVVFLSQEEIEYYANTDTSFRNDFKVIAFSDMPKNDQRFIMCSKSVSQDAMKNIDSAIAATVRLK